jgi:uncharacterized membrane-anchored protein YhcB (DUF1043 family)
MQFRNLGELIDELFGQAVGKILLVLLRSRIKGTRDITDRRLKELEAVCEEYRRLMRQHFRE